MDLINDPVDLQVLQLSLCQLLNSGLFPILLPPTVITWHSGWISVVDPVPEMEFLDINLTIDLSLLLHAIHDPFYWRILGKTMLFSGIKNPYKKSAKQEN